MEEKKFKIKTVIKKTGVMKYFSQLDLVRIFERALRRTGLPVYITKGFNPHVKMSFSNALKLGVEGEVEITFYFSEKVSCDELKTTIFPQLPQGLEIIQITEE
ncbi:MAG: TIGR03936 family radical SAM-associated protein [Candidatus Omnitrophica bacterium]|nr:TIGR03936 family radical SAM-associated protein [Candidatus Omnitrophota bacterium]